MQLRRTAPLAVTLALALGVTACGDDGDDATTDAPTTEATTAPQPDGGGDGSTSTSGPADGSTTEPGAGGSTTSEGGGDESATGPLPDEDLPGEPVDLYPYEGADLAVVGVAADDTLNVRTGPGTDFPVVAELGPLVVGFTATGRNRTLDDGSFWSEVTVDGAVGWANVVYLAEPAAPRDITGEVQVSPEGSSPADIARDVADQLSSGGEPTPTITVVAETSTEATVDLVGLGDDAQKGERIRVTVAGGAVTVEATALCARGVTDGVCT